MSPLTFGLLACCIAAAAAAVREDVKFGPLDPELTDPDTLFRPLSNPIPEDYCLEPRFPIVPSSGPIAMDVLNELYPNGTARPTCNWHKNLWGYAWTDFYHWGAIYAYPYEISPKAQNINIMYLGRPNGESGNSRVRLDTYAPPTVYNVSNASYPVLTTSAAFDFGILIDNGFPRLNAVEKVSFAVDFFDTDNVTLVATLHAVKGSPFINLVCNGSLLSFGSKLESMPPVIGLNGNPPGSNVTSNIFSALVAVGDAHRAGEWWNLYFDHPVTIYFAPGKPLAVTEPYTGLLQVACGETTNVMKDTLDKYRGVYTTGVDISYDFDDEANKIVTNFNWRTNISASAPGEELMMLAIPHHLAVFEPILNQSLPVNTSYWCIKGDMSMIIGSQWRLVYNGTNVGFGYEQPIAEKYKATLSAQLLVDYNTSMQGCPGDYAGGSTHLGYMQMELYQYLRNLGAYVDVAIVAMALDRADLAANLTAHVAACMAPVLVMQESDPEPCEAPRTNQETCVRSEVAMYYDYKWGGIVTGWYSRYAVDYYQGGDNPTGYYPFANYGNAFYSDHHFQYGYLVKNVAWILYQASNGVDVGLNATELDLLRLQGLAIARDYANPDEKNDTAFTYLRHKDHYDGHSWAEGYSYSGRILNWLNQQSGGEAMNSYYAIYLLGIALKDQNLIDWGKVNMATEMVSVRTYQHLSNATNSSATQPTPAVNDMLKCMPMIIGNGLTGATYIYPSSQFMCGITIVPVSPITQELITPSWAAEAYDWLQWHLQQGGICRYPNPLVDKTNPCSGDFDPATWWDNEFACCPLNEGFPDNLWRAFPNWFPYMYTIQAAADGESAWDNMQIVDPYTPTKELPFPYLNRKNEIVGIQPAFSRTNALFTVAAMSTKQQLAREALSFVDIAVSE